MIKLCLWSVLIVCMAGTSAYANPVLVIDGTGKLTGAIGVNVGGAFYDVEFLDGTCAAVFGACDVAHFPFAIASDAAEASQALMDQVFIDGAFGMFDSQPELTRGCEFYLSPGFPGYGCVAMTPYMVLTDWIASGAGNYPNSLDNVTGQSWACCTADLSEPYATWARWTLEDPQPVPEPASLLLFGTGLVGLRAFRKRRR